MEANGFEPYRRLLAHAEGAAKVEVSLRRDRTAAERDSQRRGNCAQRYSSTGHERLEQHIAGAESKSVAACRRVQAGFGKPLAGLHLTSDAFRIDFPSRFERDERGSRLFPIARLERRLQGPQLIRVHVFSSPRSAAGQARPVQEDGSISRNLML